MTCLGKTGSYQLSAPMRSESEMLNVLAKYCSQTERCLYDVRKKIQIENLSGDAEKRIIDKLLQDKFIDEKRFARSFVHDKFYFNRWGRIKIAYELKLRGILPEVYYEAIEAIDEDEYMSALFEILTNKKKLTKGRSSQDLFQKLYRFAASRGFETSIIVGTLKKMFENIHIDDE